MTELLTAPPPLPASSDVAQVAPALAVKDLTKRFGGRTAVDRLGFSVARGRVTGFVGPNGAGKTTTMRMLLGLIKPDGGSGEVLSHPLDDPVAYLPRVGATIEGPALYAALSGAENLRVLAELSGLGPGAVQRALERTGLADRAHDRAGSYSLGMRQRLAIATALLAEPELLILDEPTNGLDPAGIREVRALIRRCADDGAGVLVSSHLLSELETIVDDLVVLKSGRLVYAGPADGLRAGPAQLRLRGADRHPRELARLAEVCGELTDVIAVTDDEVVVQGDLELAARLNLRAMDAGIVLAAIVPEEPDLESAFFAITDGSPS